MSNKDHWTTKNIPDLLGKVAIVTGANNGIGYDAARELAKKNATVILACRNTGKGDAASQMILNVYPLANVNVMQIDLADLDSGKSFVETFRSDYDRLDILINNAGVMAIPYGKTADGFEKQFGTNHLGHFALTGLLLEMLLSTEQSRVVTISSTGHRMGKINFEDLNCEESYSKWGAYGQSKLANLLFTYELQRRLAAAGSSTISVAAHPGYTATNLQSGTFFKFLNPILAQGQEMGALPTLYAATSPDVTGGDFIGPDGFMEQRGYPKKVHSNGNSHDRATAQKLWQVSEELTGVKFNFAAQPLSLK
jgi:NAD(P)-dependent dehydrogenase (short-subunit alcohol dehydrogenase family)